MAKPLRVTLVMLLLPALLLAACGGGTPAQETPVQEPPVQETAVVELTPEVSRPAPSDCPAFPAFEPETGSALTVEVDDFMKEYRAIPGQVVVSGPPPDLEELLSREDVRALELVPVRQATSEAISFAPVDGGPVFTTQLLQIETDTSVDEAIRQLYDAIIAANQEREAAGAPPLLAFASANRLVGNPWGIDGDPWGIDADPWGIDGDPWGIDGDPAAALIPGEASPGVWKQWALAGTGGIGLYDTSVSPARRMAGGASGEGSSLFVFDTSPFKAPGAYDLMDRQLCVYHPDLIVGIAPAGSSNIREHGYFASGLARLVAPNGRFHLVRILNEDGVGDVFSFVAVLYQLLQMRADMSDTVLNLSLSLQNFAAAPGEEDPFAPTPDQQDALIALLPPEYHALVTSNAVIPALEAIMIDAHDGGAVIVAASGNSSNLPAGEDIQMGTPALWASTVGVAGNDVDGDRSCFSNQVERETACLLAAADPSTCTPDDGLFAPAGDGDDGVSSCDFPFPVEGSPEAAGYVCPPSAVGTYDCQYALTSVTTSGNGFAHWLGTSFATPLVSGTAALMLDSADGACTAASITAWLREQSGTVQVADAVTYAAAGCP